MNMARGNVGKSLFDRISDQELKSAKRVINLLSRGFDPVTQKMLDASEVVCKIEVFRALRTADEVLELAMEAMKRREQLPENAGKRWEEDEINVLAEAFKGGATVKKLATYFKRTTVAIETKLVEMGLIKEEDALSPLRTRARPKEPTDPNGAQHENEVIDADDEDDIESIEAEIDEILNRAQPAMSDTARKRQAPRR